MINILLKNLAPVEQRIIFPILRELANLDKELLPLIPVPRPILTFSFSYYHVR